MNILLPLIVLVILAVIYAGSLNNARSRLYVVVVVLILILLLCWMQMRSRLSTSMLEGFAMTGYAPLGYKLRVDDANPSASGCDGYNYMNVNNQISPLGTYDGILLPSKIETAPLMNKVFISSPVGDDIQLTEDPASKYFPSIDGTPDGEKHLFVFAKNNYGGACHSQYSTSTGQLCMSPEQVKMFMGRGKNLTPPQEYPNM
jgi:hypothetical protein